MGAWGVLGLLALLLAASFLFWIFVAYAALRSFRLGVCGVCGSVVTVWALNLAFNLLPGWVTLLLLGESVVGGATLLRDALLMPKREAMTPARFSAVTQVTWFAFILGGTLALGALGLVLAWRP